MSADTLYITILRISANTYCIIPHAPIALQRRMSLDGFIAGPKGEYDWIVHDPGFDFGALFRQFDTLLMGRRTFDLAQSQGPLLKSMRMKTVVVSTTLNDARHKDVTILSSGVAEAVAALKAESGKDIWLFGGGVLFRSLLGGGVRLLPEGGAGRSALPIARPCQTVGS
jgi:dihydrofolate reductase